MLREWRSRNRSQWFRFCPRWNTRVLASSICDGACTSITTLLFHDCKLCWWWYYDDDNVDVDNNYVDGIMHDDEYVGCQLGICPVVVTFGAMPKSKVVFFSWKTKPKLQLGQYNSVSTFFAYKIWHTTQLFVKPLCIFQSMWSSHSWSILK